MEETNLLVVCAVAFGAVFFLLIVMALTIQLIAIAFPERDKSESALLAAMIQVAVASAFPGARVTRIEERK